MNFLHEAGTHQPVSAEHVRALERHWENKGEPGETLPCIFQRCLSLCTFCMAKPLKRMHWKTASYHFLPLIPYIGIHNYILWILRQTVFQVNRMIAFNFLQNSCNIFAAAIYSCIMPQCILLNFIYTSLIFCTQKLESNKPLMGCISKFCIASNTSPVRLKNPITRRPKRSERLLF